MYVIHKVSEKESFGMKNQQTCVICWMAARCANTHKSAQKCLYSTSIVLSQSLSHLNKERKRGLCWQIGVLPSFGYLTLLPSHFSFTIISMKNKFYAWKVNPKSGFQTCSDFVLWILFNFPFIAHHFHTSRDTSHVRFKKRDSLTFI